MVQKFGQRRSGKKLADLPKSESKFWEKADKHQREMADLPKCGHFFEHRGREIICRNCNVGYYASPGMKVKKGHIYIKKKLVI
jgi:hypothetical protein